MLCNMFFLRLLLLSFAFFVTEFPLAASAFSSSDGMFKTTLPNGFKLIVVPVHKSPIATFQVWYNVGSKDESFGTTGISHMLEHTMFKGTKKHGKGEYSRLIAINGGNENAFTSKDYTAYFATLSKERIALEIELEADRMQNLTIDPKEFMLERNVVAEERRMRVDDNPSSRLDEQMDAHAFLQHPYHWPVIGWMDDIQHFTPEKARQHYERFYAPNNAIGVVVGDVDPKEIEKIVRKYFGKIPASKTLPKNRRVYQEVPQAGEVRFELKDDKVRIPYAFTGYHAPKGDVKDAYALAVIANALASGASSRLYKRLVRKEEYCVMISANYDFISAGPGYFTFYAGLRPGKSVEGYEKILNEELNKIIKNGVSKHELQKAINQVEAEFYFSQDSIFYRAMKIGMYETVGLDASLIAKFSDRIKEVTNADIKRVAARYFVKEKRTIGILLPE